ncbi:type I-E CRISPR-associated protein Cas5/CasD [Streptomyces sp. NPDC023998]|uniref:type I-E CRISPR-associated protein Cas5/CasD n=1 Tax=Streptomyces sp. NPDC023998 TaxID=3154597 RepID=UPI0033C9C7FF
MTAPIIGTALPGLLLHLSGPLQSWGHHSHFNERDTAPFPTRSGIIGLLAAALGRARGDAIDDLAGLGITVRVDRAGVLLRDLHTVGGGLPRAQTVTTAEGGKRSADATTLLSHRYYLADAAFTVAVTGQPDHPTHPALLARCAAALRRPHWPLYLGRRACPPAGPLFLGTSSDVLPHLVNLPIAAPAPRNGSAEAVEFLSDRPLDDLPVPASITSSDAADAAHPAGRINDQPVTFHPGMRAYRARPLYRRTLTPPADQRAGLGTAYLTALRAYTSAHLPALERSRR